MDSSFEHDRINLPLLRMDLAEEMDDRPKAIEIAEQFERHSAQWTMDAPLYVRAKRLYLMHESKRMSDAAFVSAREALIDEELKRRHDESRHLRDYAKLVVDARFGQSTDEAKIALLPYQTLRLSSKDIRDDAFFFGRALVLAGRPQEAIPLLESVTRTCGPTNSDAWLTTSGVDTFLEFVHAHLLLGKALEATHDNLGACRAYGVVLSRWKDAKPRSVTLEAAKERAHALGCP